MFCFKVCNAQRRRPGPPCPSQCGVEEVRALRARREAMAGETQPLAEEEEDLALEAEDLTAYLKERKKRDVN